SAHARYARGQAKHQTGHSCAVTAVVHQCTCAVALGIVEPFGEVGRAAKFARAAVRRTIDNLEDFANLAFFDHLDGLLEAVAPHGRPVDHQHLASCLGGATHARGQLSGRSHGLLDHNVQATV